MTGSLTGLRCSTMRSTCRCAPVRHTDVPALLGHATAGESEREFSRRCAAELERLILAEGPETVAAFIGEPVLGTGGLIPPPEGYWEAIQRSWQARRAADRGRGGDRLRPHWARRSAPDYYGIEPDLITIAKGLTSAYLPMSGVIVGEKVWQVLEQGSDKLGALGHGWTYSAHPTLRRRGASPTSTSSSARTCSATRARSAPTSCGCLRDAFGDHPLVGEVRGVGLLAAVEFVADKADQAPLRRRHCKVGARARRRLPRARRDRAARCRTATSWASRRRWRSAGRRPIRSSPRPRARSTRWPSRSDQRGGGLRLGGPRRHPALPRPHDASIVAAAATAGAPAAGAATVHQRQRAARRRSGRAGQRRGRPDRGADRVALPASSPWSSSTPPASAAPARAPRARSGSPTTTICAPMASRTTASRPSAISSGLVGERGDPRAARDVSRQRAAHAPGPGGARRRSASGPT